MLVENFQSDVIKEGVGNPGSVMAVLDFSEFVGTDLAHSDLVGLEVILDGDLGRHSAHGGNLAPEKIGSEFVCTKYGRGTHLWQV